MLESASLHPIIQDEHTIQWQPLYSYAIGGVKVLVPENEVEQAKEIINEFSTHKQVTRSIKNLPRKERKRVKKECPKCRRNNIIKKWDINKGILLVYLLSLIGLLLLPFTGKVYVCMDCGEKWRFK